MELEDLASSSEEKSGGKQPVYNSTQDFFVYCDLQET